MWTLAPGYFWFLAALFRLGGFHLFPIQVAQCALEAGTAVLVALLARRAAGPQLGLLAGLAYALYWPSVEQPSRTMTENLHTFLLVAAFAAVIGLVLRETPAEGAPPAEEPARGRPPRRRRRACSSACPPSPARSGWRSSRSPFSGSCSRQGRARGGGRRRRASILGVGRRHRALGRRATGG